MLCKKSDAVTRQRAERFHVIRNTEINGFLQEIPEDIQPAIPEGMCEEGVETLP